MASIQQGVGGLIGVIDRLVDKRAGIIQGIWELPPDPGTPGFFHFRSVACDAQSFGPEENFRENGGAATSRWQAMAKAAGEAVERYCAAIHPGDDLPLESYNTADFPCVSPDSFPSFDDEQYSIHGFPYSPFNKESLVSWANCVDPLTGREIAVPASLVWLPFSLRRGETNFGQSISTGLSCHETAIKAAKGAISEVLERDAFTIMWQRKVAFPQILPETLSRANYDRLRRIESKSGEITLFDLTLDHGITTVMSVLRSDLSASPAVVLAAATNIDAEDAMRESLEELAHTRRYSELIKQHVSPLEEQSDYSNVKGQVEHLAFWGDNRRLSEIDWMFASSERKSFDDLRCMSTGDASEDVRFMCEKVQETGHLVLLRDITTSDVKSLGLSVVRALIPGYHPLAMGHIFRIRTGQRLWKLPEALDLPCQTDITTGDNPLPHPYP